MRRLQVHGTTAAVSLACLSAGCAVSEPTGPVGPVGADGSTPSDASTAFDAGTTEVQDTGLPIDGGSNLEPYFPPLSGDVWETVDPASLGWDSARLEDALSYAESLSSTAVIILYRGRILVERYWQGWNLHTNEPIFSASKSVTSFLVGILWQEGRLELDDPADLHLGTGWSNAPADKAALITVRHLLTMTSGLDERLSYVADAGTVWFYNTPAYYQLFGVIAAASGVSRDEFANTRLHDRIGMSDAVWRPNNLSASARDMARFGLLILSEGVWAGTPILGDPAYLSQALDTSQDLNHAYGFLWWLNGKDRYLLPGDPAPSDLGALIPEAPADLVGALGAGDKKIYVVGSRELVVVRHGGSTGVPTLARSSFDNLFWQKIMAAAP